MSPTSEKLFNSPRLAALGLLCVAMVWGATFVLTHHVLESYPVFAFLGWRFLIATISFGLLCAKPLMRSLANLHRPSLNIALFAGVFLSLGYIFQTYGLIPATQGGTTPARAAFITGLYVVLVPLSQFLLSKQRPSPGIFFGIIFAMIGLWFLSGLGSDSGQSYWVWGDTMVVICSVAYTIHMLILGRADESYSTVLMTFIQLTIVTLICASMSVVTHEHASFPQGFEIWSAIIICGVFASAFAFAIQTWAQQVMVPARVALILVSEPAFGGIFGWFAAGFVLRHELIGSTLMLGAMILSELWGIEKTTTEPSLEGPIVMIDDQ
ncbi:MAG: DMT family transporter [Coriobacteriia bacterium]|nr:DMT family transporter [Coriobacteriia bacterium]